MPKLPFVAVLSLALAACSDGAPPPPPTPAPAKTDAAYREEAVAGMHDALLADIRTLHAAARRHAGAPRADHAWDAGRDAVAIDAMRASWRRARTRTSTSRARSAPLFPDIDNAIDARYDDFMTQLEAQGGDKDLFDGEGVTGMHAIERILWAPRAAGAHRRLRALAARLLPAAFPATDAEARELRTGLCDKLVADVATLEAQWSPANIDAAIAFQGLIQLVQEQREKVQKAASDEEESRYSQRTMADLRDNLLGAEEVYAMFQPWLRSKGDAGEAADAKIHAGFRALEAAYAEVPGDAIPEPPPTWSAEAPSEADLATPFGELYTAVTDAVGHARPGSTVDELERAASLLGFPEFEAAP